MDTTPETENEIGSIRKTCLRSLIRIKNTLHSCEMASKWIEMRASISSAKDIRSDVQKVNEMSAEVVQVMADEVFHMRTTIFNVL
ncbi:hypothetical protein CEXT_623331 [Caerostris extrusa]|uniref:Uncharacterized protein n=1 Tax=Caerostris extrusa TaxID=172846 RepID=A0AAV4P0F1_CAEEX|nr:hypothetical protein CEXT_623331 [Caerostris extrusa]